MAQPTKHMLGRIEITEVEKGWELHIQGYGKPHYFYYSTLEKVLDSAKLSVFLEDKGTNQEKFMVFSLKEDCQKG